jgi:hypothetical protein
MKNRRLFSCLAAAIVLTAAVAHAGPLKFEVTPSKEIKFDYAKGLPVEFRRADVPCEIRTPKPGEEQLWQGERLIFTAKSIESPSCTSLDPAVPGTWVVSAVTGDRPPITGEGPEATLSDGKRILDISPDEIWLIAPDGKSPRRISSPRMDARGPLISPDGRTVAFTASMLDEGNIPGETKLYLVDVASGEVTLAAKNEQRPNDYSISASAWSADSRTLTLTEVWGENDTRRAVRTLKLLPPGLPISRAEPEGSASMSAKIEEMKSANPNFTDWLPVNFEDREFVFCQNIHPGFGVSVIDFYGWQYDKPEGKWEPLMHVVAKGVGKAVISFNGESGIISVRGDANNRFKDAVIASMDLRATVL